MEWLNASDGSYVAVRHVYRWSIQEDVTKHAFTIVASIQGAQQPFKIRTLDTRQKAEEALSHLISYIEGA